MATKDELKRATANYLNGTSQNVPTTGNSYADSLIASTLSRFRGNNTSNTGSTINPSNSNTLNVNNTLNSLKSSLGNSNSTNALASTLNSLKGTLGNNPTNALANVSGSLPNSSASALENALKSLQNNNTVNTNTGTINANDAQKKAILDKWNAYQQTHNVSPVLGETIKKLLGIEEEAKPVTPSNNNTTPGKSKPVQEAEKNVETNVDRIKNYLDEQKKQADAYYKTLYESELSKNRQQYEADRNQANLDYKRTDRYLNNMYGDQVSGAGLSNRTRNNINWNNNLSSIRTDYANRNANSLADYNRNLSNTANALSQGWYNYVLPVYTNRQNTTDNMDYQTWAYQKQLENNRLMNQDDLDYRLKLASMGLTK